LKRKQIQQCIKENQLIETGDKDKALAKELLKLAEHKQNFWNEAKLEEKYPSLYLEGHYEIIKELCTAILALDGWKALNHECLFSYLKEQKQQLELDFEYLLELKDTRNAIDYRGTKISPETWQKNKLKIQLTIKTLKEHIQNNVTTQ